MARPVWNPRNPWLARELEALEPASDTRLEVHEEVARSALTRNDSPDLPFRWSLNPYRGCQHACAYCYARPTHQYLGLGAGTDLRQEDLRQDEPPRAPGTRTCAELVGGRIDLVLGGDGPLPTLSSCGTA